MIRWSILPYLEGTGPVEPRKAAFRTYFFLKKGLRGLGARLASDRAYRRFGPKLRRDARFSRRIWHLWVKNELWLLFFMSLGANLNISTFDPHSHIDIDSDTYILVWVMLWRDLKNASSLTFPPITLFTISSRRSRLSRTTSGHTRLIRPRPIDCDSGRDRQMNKIFLYFFSPAIFCFNIHIAKKRFFTFFSRPLPLPNADLHPQKAHSRIFVTGGSFFARHSKKNSFY